MLRSVLGVVALVARSEQAWETATKRDFTNSTDILGLTVSRGIGCNST